MPVALLTNVLAGYRIPLYRRLAERCDVEVLCFGAGARYVPSWFSDLEAQIAAAPFPARAIASPREAFAAGRSHSAVIAPVAGGAMLPAAYSGARRAGVPFVLWASIWARPRTRRNDLAWPLVRRIHRRADAVVAYGEHVRRFVRSIRGGDDDVLVAPQCVEADLFGREVAGDEVAALRERHGLGDGPLVLYAGRLVPEKGVEVLLDAWRGARRPAATLVLAGEGPLAAPAGGTPGVRVLGPLPREGLAALYAASAAVAVPSLTTPAFLEPWGLVCNEAMLQARPVVATPAVGAVAGGLVRHGETGLVVPERRPDALAEALAHLLAAPAERERLGAAGRDAAHALGYDDAADAFASALRIAGTR